MKQTVFVIDDDLEVCEALRWLFDSMEVDFVCYNSAEEFLDVYRGQLGCLILDVRMTGMSGLKLQEELRSRSHDIPVIFVTGHGDVPMAVRAMKAGAVEFLTKPFNNQQLLDVVHESLEKSRNKYKVNQEREEIMERIRSLTTREKEVLQAIVTGRINKVIAAEMGISPHTVEIHRAKIMKKMKAKTLGELLNMILSFDLQPSLREPVC